MALQPSPSDATALDYEHGRQTARRIFSGTLTVLDVRRQMLKKLRFADGVLMAGEEIVPITAPPYVVSFGKAAVRMAAALDEILDGKVKAGVVVAPAVPARKLGRFVYYEAGHPYPSHGSFEGAAAALEMLSGLTPEDLVIFLVSGGGSSLFELPLDPAASLADLVEFNRALVTGELAIEQINVLRKHISAVKGGRLAAKAYPARQFTVYISDVPEPYPSMVASGPTMPDESTAEQCYELAERYGLLAKFPRSIRQHLEQRSLEETPKPRDERFSRSNYYCMLSNRDAVEAAFAFASHAGFHTEIDSGVSDADYRQVVESGLQSLDGVVNARQGRPVCLVMGGEVTCPVTGHGVGGRNLAFALVAAQTIEGQRRVVLCGATDGRDGNSPSSGGVADGHTVPRARALGLESGKYLAESDSYHFFRALGDTIETGFTDNNVRDLRLLMSFE